MNMTLDRPLTPSGGNAQPKNVPNWLLPLHMARAKGQVPARRWVLLSLGVNLARRLPWIAVPADYRPGKTDDLSALAGIDCEIVIDDQARYGSVQDLAARILDAGPRRLLLQTFGRYPAVCVLKGGAHGN